MQAAQHYSPQSIKKNPLIPFKDHPKHPLITDTLLRKAKHHLFLYAEFSASYYAYFLEALLFHLAQETIPYALRESELYYLGETNDLIKECKIIETTLTTRTTFILIVIHREQWFQPANQPSLATLLSHPLCRIIVLSDQTTKSFDFNQHHTLMPITLDPLSETDRLCILKLQRALLEQFHHVLIPEEALTLAYSLAERYLGTDNALENAILLLDTSAGRIGHYERHDNSKPLLTQTTLLNTLSNWTQIPATHLLPNKIKQSDFIQYLQQRIFGQEVALNLIAQTLEESQLNLQHRSGPLCRLLFCGPKHVGKKTLALTLAEALYQQAHALYIAKPCSSIKEDTIHIQFECPSHHGLVEWDTAIRETPYALFMFEDCERLPQWLWNDLYDILTTGYLNTADGKRYCFRQTIFIFTTTLGKEAFTALPQPQANTETTKEMDLMQLIMSEYKPSPSSLKSLITPQELIQTAFCSVENSLPPPLLSQMQIIPFVPLNQSAIEPIVRQKLNTLTIQLSTQFQIELSYAPEIIHYLVNMVLNNKAHDTNAPDTDKALSSLYVIIEQTISYQSENKHKPRRLFLQLNETGQLLKCDWILASMTH